MKLLAWAAAFLVGLAAGCVVATATGRVGAEPWELPGIYHTIHLASQEFGVSADFMVCVAQRESRLERRAQGDWLPRIGYRAAGLWQFHRATFATAARLAGYPEPIAQGWPLWAQDVGVSTRAAAALMARPDLGGRRHWTTAPACAAWWR